MDPVIGSAYSLCVVAWPILRRSRASAAWLLALEREKARLETLLAARNEAIWWTLGAWLLLAISLHLCAQVI